MKKSLLIFFLLFFHPVFSQDLKTLYHTLDPRSVSQNLAFYELHPQSEEGRLALQRVCDLLQTDQSIEMLSTAFNQLRADSLTDAEVELIEQLAASFPNRKLQGYLATSEEQLFALPAAEIDLGKALILSQVGEGAERCARSYSALLDLMALQIKAKLSATPSAKETIDAMNQFIFNEMHFRFPPQSIYAKDIDLYTFLPSVMDNHLGVCLGVTALYLALAQRLDLPLEIVTPPGHIFVRYHKGGELINIETTARGVNMPSEKYLGINTRRLQLRDIKEVIGLTHINQASAYLHKERFADALAVYKKALPYLKDDPLLKELLAYSYILTGKKEQGRALLEEIRDLVVDSAATRRTLPADYLEGKVDEEGICAIFLQVDQTRESIENKLHRLERVLKKYPEFKEGLEQLAICWIQLNRVKEAIDALIKYYALYPDDPTVNYYLAVLHGQRQDFKSCWSYLLEAERITLNRRFYPKVLKELRFELTAIAPP